MAYDDMTLALSDARPRTELSARRHARAWLLLVAALALHVVDEALTGFLDFYNPLVLNMREQNPWFPMPTFTFAAWISGLVVLVMVLGILTPAVRDGAIGTRAASWALALIMFVNGAGHLVGSVYFERWLPGATSAPLLLVASGVLAAATWRRRLTTRLRT